MSPAEPLIAVLLDVGGILVLETAPTSPVDQLVPQLLPSVREDVEWLSSRYRLGAVTNTSVMTETDVRRLLDAAGIGRYLEVVITSVDVGAAKPDPLPIRVALERLGVAAAVSLYIGDRENDRIAAVAAGCHFAPIDGTLRETVDRYLSESVRSRAGDRA